MVHDTYCCFCSGPLDDARLGWLNAIEDNWPPPKEGRWINISTKDEIVTISYKDGETWNDWVVVTPVWPETYVSPSCTFARFDYVEIQGNQDWNTNDHPYLHIHRICLSFLCRRNAITPRELWESFYNLEDSYDEYRHWQGLLNCVDYYDMQDRASQDFLYGPSTENLPDLMWWAPESMEKTGWILARPTVLPAPQPLEPSTVRPSGVAQRKVFEISELMNEILAAIVDIPEEVIDSELKTNGKEEGGEEGHEEGEVNEGGEDGEDGEEGEVKEEGEDGEDGEEGEVNEEGEDSEDEEEDKNIFQAPSAVTAVKTLLSLSQVDRWFYHAIIRNRQSVFLQAIRNFGWMLPCTPTDWADSNWSIDLTTQIPLSKETHIDWRRYMITCLQRETPHLMNRWRFNVMAVQFARGTDRHRDEEDPDWFWNVGKLGIKNRLEKPEPEVWELPPKRRRSDT